MFISEKEKKLLLEEIDKLKSSVEKLSKISDVHQSITDFYSSMMDVVGVTQISYLTLSTILIKKGIITQEEFYKAKAEATVNLRKEMKKNT